MEETAPKYPEEPFDFDFHRMLAVSGYQRIRPLYESFAQVVQGILIQALITANIKVASVEARAKDVKSLAAKSVRPNVDNPNSPAYTEPLKQIEDLAAARVVTFFLRTIDEVDNLIKNEFQVLERADKTDALVRDEKLGYRSVHYIISLKPNRVTLPEYVRYDGLKAELQLRTVLQHAWAEIEHDIQYKSLEAIPTPIRRRFMALAGLLEIADREFQAVQLDDEDLRQKARASVAAGRLEDVEITGDALKAYLDKKLGADGRVAQWSYDYSAGMLRRFGFRDFKQIDEAMSPYDPDMISRTIHGGRMGQLTRFEDVILAALGDIFVEAQSNATNWWRSFLNSKLSKVRAAGIQTGVYRPPPLE